MSPDANAIRFGSETKNKGQELEVTKEELAVGFRPLGSKICVRPISGEVTTASGLIIPDNSQGEKPQEGWIIAIGKAVDTKGDDIAVGDRVLFSRYAGDEIRIKDEKGKENEIKILHFESLLGVVESKHDKSKSTRKVK